MLLWAGALSALAGVEQTINDLRVPPVNRLALSMRVPPQKINDIVRGKRGITADTALRLSIVLGTSAEFWMGLQSDYDLETTLDAPGDRLQKEITPFKV